MKLLNVFEKEKINTKDTIKILILIMVFSAIFGFVYEEVFYYIDLGHLVKRGSSFGPWIPIYAWGGLLITLFTYKLKDRPLLVFILNLIITGLLEFISGYILFHVFHERLWDYNLEIWNFLNIGGYTCLRSVLFFGISSLILIYLVIPTILKVYKKISDNKFNILAYSLGIVFFADIIIYSIIK